MHLLSLYLVTRYHALEFALKQLVHSWRATDIDICKLIFVLDQVFAKLEIYETFIPPARRTKGRGRCFVA